MFFNSIFNLTITDWLKGQKKYWNLQLHFVGNRLNLYPPPLPPPMLDSSRIKAVDTTLYRDVEAQNAKRVKFFNAFGQDRRSSLPLCSMKERKKGTWFVTGRKWNMKWNKENSLNSETHSNFKTTWFCWKVRLLLLPIVLWSIFCGYLFNYMLDLMYWVRFCQWWDKLGLSQGWYVLISM